MITLKSQREIEAMDRAEISLPASPLDYVT